MSDEKYLVWAMRRSYGCYDCGNVEKIEGYINAPSISMDEETFQAFIRGASRYRGEYVYLYRLKDDFSLSDQIFEMVKKGKDLIEFEKKIEEDKKIKEEEKIKRKKLKEELEAKKIIERERALFEKLKTKFDK